MAKKRKRNAQRPIVEDRHEVDSETLCSETGKRNKTRALILGALAAGGVFQMNSWQIQAHGNRSSHSATTTQHLYISPDDYVLMRGNLTAPNLSQTSELADVTLQMRSLLADGGTPDSPEYQALAARKAALEEEIGATRRTRQVLQFLDQGDVDGAVAAIEGEGWTEQVLGQYLFTLLDIANQISGTTAWQDKFVAIARPAAAYSERVLTTLPGSGLPTQDTAAKERAAEVLHNIASFIALMNPIDQLSIDLGRAAAARSLAVRTELNRPREIMRAHWMVAQYHIRANRTDDAMNSLTISLQQAQALNDVPGYAWARFSMSKALKGVDPARSAQYYAEARDLAQGFEGEDTTIDFLRQEFQSQ